MKTTWTPEEDSVLYDTTKSYNQLLLLLPGRSKSSAYARANKLGIKRDQSVIARINSENQRKDAWTELLKDTEFCQVIDGELLADGCIFRKKINGRKCYEYSFIAGSIHREYAEYLRSFIAEKLQSTAKINIIPPKIRFGRRCRPFYSVRFSSVVFRHFYDRWYPKCSIKTTIPDDLILSSKLCLHWYWGDGSLDSRINARMFELCLHTENFSKASVEKLRLMLENVLLAKVSIGRTHKKYFKLRIHGDEARKFLNYIGPNPLACFAYKWKDWKEVSHR